MARLDPTGVSRILSYIKNWVTTALGGKANSSHSHTKSQITDFPTIPSSTSQLTNDSGFLTSHQDLSGYVPKSGGAVLNNTSWSRNVDDDYLLISGGTSWTNGAHIVLNGKNRASEGGGFVINAKNDSYQYQLVGGVDGSLTWGGTAISLNGHTHTKSQITDFPTIPSNTSQLTNDSGYITSSGSCNYANSAGNSDTLDGYHEYSFLRNRGATSASGEGTLWAQIGIKEYYNALPDGLNDVYGYGETVSLAGTSCRFDIYCSHNSSNGNGLYYRSGWNDDKKAWRCFIDSANIGSQSVNYATNSGYTNWLRTSSHTDHLFHTEWDGTYFWTYVTASDGGYRAVRVERSNSSGYADSCTEAAYMGQYETITYGVNRLQYFNSPTSTTSGAANIANPYNDWFYHLLMSHGNGQGYYGDLALCFHSNTLAFRRIVAGGDQGWTYLVKNGRTIVSGYEVYVG